MTDVSHTYWARCCEPRVCDTFDIPTFAISIVDILTFRYFDFDIVTVRLATQLECRHFYSMLPRKTPVHCWKKRI